MGDKTLSDVLTIQKDNDAVNFFIDKKLIATYSEELAGYPGKEVSMQKHNFPGFVYLDAGFFSRLGAETHSGSDMVNLAKAFFPFNENNHVCLVQFLPKQGCSREHAHSLEEHITCLAGRASLRLSQSGNELNEKNVILNPGDVICIPPETFHLLSTDQGSITIPVKQTIKGMKDHIYKNKPEKRIMREFDALVNDPVPFPYFALLATLDSFYSDLNDNEQVVVRRYLKTRARERNPKLIIALDKFREMINDKKRDPCSLLRIPTELELFAEEIAENYDLDFKLKKNSFDGHGWAYWYEREGRRKDFHMMYNWYCFTGLEGGPLVPVRRAKRILSRNLLQGIFSEELSIFKGNKKMLFAMYSPKLVELDRYCVSWGKNCREKYDLNMIRLIFSSI